MMIGKCIRNFEKKSDQMAAGYAQIKTCFLKILFVSRHPHTSFDHLPTTIMEQLAARFWVIFVLLTRPKTQPTNDLIK